MKRLAVITALLIAPTVALAAGGPVYAPDVLPLTPRAELLIRPVRDAIKAKETELAAGPAAASDAERLERMAELEQAAREALYGVDLSPLTLDERQAALDAAWSRVEAIDKRNQAALKKMLPADGGWFGRTAFGEEAARAAWLIAVHAVKDRGLMREAARRMEPLVATGEVMPAWYASVVDRLAVLEGRPQTFGTQPVCRRGTWVMGEVEDPEGLDRRRAELGLQAMDSRDFRPPPGC
jgi:hypothetical protein